MEQFFERDDEFAGTKGLVFIGGRILVYRRDGNTSVYPHFLDVPGGGAEANETPFETFRREVREEFGLDILKQQICYARRYPSTQDPGKFGWYTVAKLPDTAKTLVRFGDEGSEYMLMELNDFLHRADAWPVYQQRANEYAQSIA